MEQAHAQACSPGVLDDAPDCTCFQDHRTWDPSGDLLTVAEQTARHPGDTSTGVSESCNPPVSSGGKPFWQMRWGFTSWGEANLAGGSNPTHWGSLVREAWCSETVSFWHREAGLPYTDGYRSGNLPSWRFNGSGGLQQYYAGEEAAHDADPTYQNRVFWLDDAELDMSSTGLGPGYDLPCPGAYQRLVEYVGPSDPDGPWKGVHSQVVYEMTIHEDVFGNVCEVEITTIDGNWNHTTRVNPIVRTLPDHAQGYGPELLGDIAIDGWGIDLVQVGGSWVPSCDSGRITTVGEPYCGPPLPISGNIYPVDWTSFLLSVHHSGIEYGLDGVFWWDDRLPQPSVANTWVLPGASFADGIGVFEVVWPEELPFPTRELEFELATPDLTGLVVHALDEGGAVLSTSTSHTSLAEPRVWVEMDASTQPTSLRLVLNRSSMTDVEVLDLMVHPDTEEDDAVYP